MIEFDIISIEKSKLKAVSLEFCGIKPAGIINFQNDSSDDIGTIIVNSVFILSSGARFPINIVILSGVIVFDTAAKFPSDIAS